MLPRKNLYLYARLLVCGHQNQSFLPEPVGDYHSRCARKLRQTYLQHRLIVRSLPQRLEGIVTNLENELAASASQNYDFAGNGRRIGVVMATLHRI